MADAGYFADAYDEAPARPARVRVLCALLWINAAITGVMVVAGAVAAGVSVDVIAHLVVLAAPGVVAGAIAWRITRGSSRTGRAPLVWLLAAMGWQAVRAVSVLLGGDPRGFTSMLLPLAIIVLAASRPVRAYLRSPHPSPYGGRGDTGASAIEYAGLIVLAALILGSLVALGLPSELRSGTGTALCRIFSPGDCTPTSRRARPNPGDPNGNPNSGTTPSGTSPNTRQPSFAGLTINPCRSLTCVWKRLTTDPYNWAQRTPCNGILTCAVHGFYLAEGAQWNVQKAAIDDVKGIGNLVTDPGSLIDAGKYIWQHPGDALRQLVWDDDSAKQWSHGNYVGAVSRTIWNVGSWVLPGVDIGKAFSKAGKFAKLADKAGELGRLARSTKAASDAAARATRLARKGDAKGARAAAKEARRNADAATRQARKDGCAVALPMHAVPVLPHFGRYGAAALPACAMHESEDARKARQAAEKAEKEAIRSSIKKVSTSQAKKLLRKYDTEPEAFKREFVGRAGGKFDIAKASDGKLYLISKDGKTIVPTGYDA